MSLSLQRLISQPSSQDLETDSLYFELLVHFAVLMILVHGLAQDPKTRASFPNPINHLRNKLRTLLNNLRCWELEDCT